jgi:transcriptional regulator
MYTPRYFREPDQQNLLRFIRENSFATLVSSSDGALLASHIPLDLKMQEDGSPLLIGHLARANDQWSTLSPDHAVLAIFVSPSAYISPRWYDHVNVPTWNYMAVHVYGRPRIIEDSSALFALVKEQVEKYETGSDHPYRAEDLPEDFLRRELRGIVGVAIPVERIEASVKLSQNRNPRDYQNIITELRNRQDPGSLSIADLMKEKCPHHE